MTEAKWIFPIRKYKANDPYFYEVDNIPLHQIEENLQYLKDRLPESGSTSLSLKDISDLRVDLVAGRTIKINPGRFIARVNDAYNKQGLSDLTVASGIDLLTTIGYINNKNTSFYASIIDNIINDINGGGKSWNFNGLELANLVYITKTETEPLQTVVNSIGLEDVAGYFGTGTNVGYWDPNSAYFPNTLPLTFTALNSLVQSKIGNSYQDISKLNSLFIQQWRGAIRTAVVDIPDELTVDIPEFDNFDYFYASGSTVNSLVKTSLADKASHRIDLIFLYSHPVDASSTTISDFPIGFTVSTTQITKASVGILRGAGIGIHFNSGGSFQGVASAIQTFKNFEGPAILPNLNDQNSTANTGIKQLNGVTIHGSFPSPDDLMNITPNLLTALEDNDPQLVGQTILPLAYVVVRKGISTLTANDILDIRPFLRTAELSYNERAGIAAANPKLSFGNPVVTNLQLKDTAKKIMTTLGGQFNSVIDAPRPLYTDYIMGGLAYGVEGTLLSMSENTELWTTLGSIISSSTLNSFNQFNNLSQSQKTTIFNTIFSTYQSQLKNSWLRVGEEEGPYQNLPANRIIPIWPEWDPNKAAENFFTQSLKGGTAKHLWWMYFGWIGDFNAPNTYGKNLKYAPLGPSYNLNNLKTSRRTGPYNACTKSIEIVLPSWANAYDVQAEYVLCSPRSLEVATITGLRINKSGIVNQNGKKVAKFTIVSYANNGGFINDFTDTHLLEGPAQTQFGEPFNNDIVNIGGHLAYLVTLPEDLNPDIESVEGIPRAFEKLGMSFYPTVKFTVFAFKENNFKGPSNGTLINTNNQDFSLTVPPQYSVPRIDLS